MNETLDLVLSNEKKRESKRLLAPPFFVPRACFPGERMEDRRESTQNVETPSWKDMEIDLLWRKVQL